MRREKYFQNKGTRYATSVQALSEALKVQPRTVRQYALDEDGPLCQKLTSSESGKEHDQCYDIEAYRQYMLHKATDPRLLKKLSGGAIASAADKPTGGKAKMAWKDRAERARALKIEAQVAVMRAEHVPIQVVADFFAKHVNEFMSDMRALFESDLPARDEGKTAQEIRKLHKAELDLIFGKAQELRDQFIKELNDKHERLASQKIDLSKLDDQSSDT
jgi:hypothetical protein